MPASSHLAGSSLLPALANCRVTFSFLTPFRHQWQVISTVADSLFFCRLDVCFISGNLQSQAHFLPPLAPRACSRRRLLSSWSDSLLALCLEQVSNLINGVIRPQLLPGCFTPGGRVHPSYVSRQSAASLVTTS